MVYLIAWFMLSCLAAAIAANKGNSVLGFFMLSFLLSQLTGIIVALAISENKNKNKNEIENKQINDGSMKKCPFCAELVKQEAQICKYCRSELECENDTKSNTIIKNPFSISDIPHPEGYEIKLSKQCEVINKGESIEIKCILPETLKDIKENDISWQSSGGHTFTKPSTNRKILRFEAEEEGEYYIKCMVDSTGIITGDIVKIIVK